VSTLDPEGYIRVYTTLGFFIGFVTNLILLWVYLWWTGWTGKESFRGVD